MKKILVTCAPGSIGELVVEELLQHSTEYAISVMVKDETEARRLSDRGVRVVTGNYDDYRSLTKAFQGIDKLYLECCEERRYGISQDLNAIRAAYAAGVGHLLYTSLDMVPRRRPSPLSLLVNSHMAAEVYLIRSGLPYTILRHGVCSDILPEYLGHDVLATRIILFPAGLGKVAWVTRRGLAAAGAKILLDMAPTYVNECIRLAGEEILSFKDIADLFSDLTGQLFRYFSPGREAFEEALRLEGLPEYFIQPAGALATSIANHEYNEPAFTIREILGRAPETVATFLKRAYNFA